MKEPRVVVALAVYHPQPVWLQKQLQSLASQSYTNFQVLVWLDDPGDRELVTKLLATCLPADSFTIAGAEHLGVTGAFEALTQKAEGAYIAYCDQDDIWEKEKMAVMVAALQHQSEAAACHVNAVWIDEKDQISDREFYPEQIEILQDREYQKKTFAANNWTLGCAMILPLTVAKKALPFPKMIYHDQWLAIFAVFQGKFLFLPEKLLRHRLHGENNSQMLAGIDDKAGYYQKKLEKDHGFFAFLQERLPQEPFYQQLCLWANARQVYRHQFSLQSARTLWQYGSVRRSVTLFELCLPFFSDFLLSFLIAWIRKLK